MTIVIIIYPRLSPLFWGTSDMERNHTYFHTLGDKTSPNKKMNKNMQSNFRYPTTSEYTEIQLTSMDQCGQDQTPSSSGTASRTEIPSF